MSWFSMFAVHEDLSAKCIEILLWLLIRHWSRQGAHDFSVPIFWDRRMKKNAWVGGADVPKEG